MRKIKFKIYDTKIKKNITFLCFFRRLIELYMTGKLNESEAVELTVSDKDLVLVQYTGLKDKNGKEIYEGDILGEGNEVFGVVVWDEKNTRFAIKFDNYLDPSRMSLYDWFEHWKYRDWEVIGNIYENPELLEEVK